MKRDWGMFSIHKNMKIMVEMKAACISRSDVMVDIAMVWLLVKCFGGLGQGLGLGI